MPAFTDLEIENIFGADDAENERPERLLEYFYYNGAYEALTSAIRIRILVGHKGVGKSAWLKRSFLADQAAKQFSVWLRPNDLEPIRSNSTGLGNFSARVELWKDEILRE